MPGSTRWHVRNCAPGRSFRPPTLCRPLPDQGNPDDHEVHGKDPALRGAGVSVGSAHAAKNARARKIMGHSARRSQRSTRVMYRTLGAMGAQHDRLAYGDSDAVQS